MLTLTCSVVYYLEVVTSTNREENTPRHGGIHQDVLEKEEMD